MNWTNIKVEDQDVIVSDVVLGRAAAKLLEGYTPDYEQHRCCRFVLTQRRACWHQAAAVLARYWLAHRDEYDEDRLSNALDNHFGVYEPANVLRRPQ